MIFSTTPSDAMETFLTDPRLDIHIELAAMLTAFRLYCCDQWTTSGYDTRHSTESSQ